MHILLVRFSSLGDIVMQTGFPSWIKYINRNIKVSFITSKEFTSLLEGHSHIDQVIGYERKKGLEDIKHLRQTVQKIHKENPIDFIIDLHGTTRSFFLKLVNFEIPSINPDKRRTERFFLLKFHLDFMKKMRTIHSRYIHDLCGLFSQEKHILEAVDFNQDEFKNNKLHFTTPTKDYEWDREDIKKPYIAIAPVASFAPKRWDIQNFKELIKRTLEDEKFKDYSIVNIAGPADSFCDELNTINDNRFLNLQGKTSLAESSKIVSHANFIVGNDSGMGHIAESYGVPVLSIFGPTSESLGFKPHLENSKTISKKLWCRPCSPTGKRKCFRKKQYCMEDISVEEVLKEMKGFI